MVRNDLEALKVANAQRARATADMLLKKRRVEKKVPFVLQGDGGEKEEVELLFRSIGGTEYDNMVSKYPPTEKQKKDGVTYNLDKFAPALLAAVCTDPDIEIDTWKQIWASEDWNRGELMHLFINAVDVCTSGLTVDPTDSD
jgi:hypothetical protein